jgi:hypothetical protein
LEALNSGQIIGRVEIVEIETKENARKINFFILAPSRAIDFDFTNLKKDFLARVSNPG